MRNQTNQMPAAWMYDWETPEGEFIQNMTTDDFGSFAGNHVGRISNIRPLYFGALPSPWKGLTNEDKQIAFDDSQEGGGFWEFADAIEAILKRKNNGKDST